MSSRDQRYIKLISSARWHHLRDLHLSMHPECAECLKHGVHTTEDLTQMEVHHIQPIEDALPNVDQMSALCFNPNNLVTLCRYHHRELHNSKDYHKGYRIVERKEQVAEEYLKQFR